MRYILLILILIVPLGCRENKSKTYELTGDQLVALVNALVGLKAAIGLSDYDTRSALQLMFGAEGFLTGGLANVKDTPEAQFNQEQLLSSTEARDEYERKGAETKANPPAGADLTFWAAVGSALMIAAGFAYRFRGVLVNLPGVGSAIGGFMELGYTFAPQSFRDKLAQGEQKAMNVARQAVAYGHAVETIAELDPDIRAKIEEVKDAARTMARDSGLDPVLRPILEDIRKSNPLKKTGVQ